MNRQRWGASGRVAIYGIFAFISLIFIISALLARYVFLHTFDKIYHNLPIKTLQDVYGLNFTNYQWMQITYLYNSQYMPSQFVTNCDRYGCISHWEPGYNFYFLDQVDLYPDQIQKLQSIGDKNVSICNTVLVSITAALVVSFSVAMLCMFIYENVKSSVKIDTFKDFCMNFGKYVVFCEK